METFQQHLSSGPGLAADLDALFAPPPPGHSGDGVPTFSGDTPMALAGPAVLRAPPPPSAVAAAFAAAQPLPAQPSPPLAGPASQQKEVAEAERRAIAREKNRMAQRRFRDKERARLAEVQHRADALGREMERLRLENAELAHWQQLMEKTLAVRNAMLALMNQLEPSAVLGGQGAAAPDRGGLIGGDSGEGVAAASSALVAAVGELPRGEELEAMLEQLDSSEGGGDGESSRSASPPGAAQQPRNQQQEQAQAQGSVAAAASEAAAAGDVGAPPVRLADVVAASASQGSLAAEPLMEVGAPAPDKPDLRSRVEEFESVDQLVAAWHDHKGRMRAAYAAAERARFAPGCEALGELEDSIGSLAELFWYAAQLRPALFKGFWLASLPPRHADMRAHWHRVAAASLDIASDREIAGLRRAWQRYMRRAAVIAVGARPWAARLQEVVCRGGTGALAETSSRFLTVGEVTRQLAAACDEQYAAVMGFLADIGRHVSPRLRVFWQLATEDFLPDHPAIIPELLRLHHQRQRAAEGAALPPPPAPDGGSGCLAAPVPPLLLPGA